VSRAAPRWQSLRDALLLLAAGAVLAALLVAVLSPFCVRPR
jgi:integral membrane sensor domain MASE1